MNPELIDLEMVKLDTPEGRKVFVERLVDETRRKGYLGKEVIVAVVIFDPQGDFFLNKYSSFKKFEEDATIAGNSSDEIEAVRKIVTEPTAMAVMIVAYPKGIFIGASYRLSVLASQANN